MNKKGQALITFVLLLPLFLLILAFVVDSSVSYNKKIEIGSIVKTALKNNHDIKKSLDNNKIKYKNLEIKEENKEKCVIIESSVDSIFGSIVGIKEYEIEVRKCKR